jgi:hypothetical protein
MRPLLLATVLLLAAAPLAAQERATVTIARATPDRVQQALATELAAQKFEAANHNNKHALYVVDQGRQMRPDGTELKVHYELDFRWKPAGDSLRVWLQSESMVGVSRDGNELRTERDPKANLSSFQTILDKVKASLEQSADSTTKAQ